MRKLYLLGFLIILSQQISSQQAYYELNVNGRVNASGSDCGNNSKGGLQWIAARFTDASYSTLVRGNREYPDRGIGLRNTNFNETIQFNDANVVTRFELFTTRRTSDNVFGVISCNPTQESYSNPNPVITTCASDSYNFSDLGLNQPGNFAVEVTPIVELPTPTTFNIGSDDVFVIEPIVGVQNTYFNWEYSINGANWTDFSPNFQNNNFINALGSQIIDESNHGSNVSIRVNTGCNNSFSNVLVFNYLLSAPHINSDPLTTETTCFDAIDGTAKVRFDRPLKAGETLSIALEKYNEINGNYEGFSPDMDGDGDPNTNPLLNLTTLDPDNSFLITNLPHGEYRIKLLGFYNSFNTYTEGSQHTAEFVITRPTPVSFTTSKVDVWCNGGSDGEISLTANGGVGNYEYAIRLNGETSENWQAFSAANTHTILGLAPNNYEILVRDGNACYAKEIQSDANGVIVGLGEPIIEPIQITEPNEPVAVAYVFSQAPTAFGFNNGIITTQITGGTPNANGTYNYTWLYEGNPIPTADIDEEVLPNGQGFLLTIDTAAAGIYSLTVTDANNSDATDLAGCRIDKSEFELGQPDPLQVELSIQQEISCHVDNEFGNEIDTTPQDGQRDESQDGAIIANVTGGVPFTSGEPYLYTWKKQNENGIWEVLTNQTNHIAAELSDGNYAFNVADANGNILGVYENNTLQQETDSILYLAQPPKLELSLSATATTCASGSDGIVQANVSGGTAPYTYYWSNGETGEIPELTNLSPNNYFVRIVDAKGCSVEGSIAIEQPDDYYMEVVAQNNPDCYLGSNGNIDIEVFGGTGAYTFLWSNGATTEDITNLAAGNYSVTITDETGCSLFQEFTIEDPEKIQIDLGPNRLLCNGQSLMLDARIADNGASYSWSANNGFTSNQALVELSNAGVYTVTIETSLGCIVQDSITIERSFNAIDSKFLISSQAYVNEEVVLVNISDPKGETTIWDIPDSVIATNESENSIILEFEQQGNYEIGMRSTQGGCYKDFVKNIVVEESRNLPDVGDSDNPFVLAFTLTPNPNNGNFQIAIALAEESAVSIRIFNYVGELVSNVRNESGSDTYNLNFQETLPQGNYLVVLETAKGTFVKRMIRL